MRIIKEPALLIALIILLLSTSNALSYSKYDSTNSLLINKLNNIFLTQEDNQPGLSVIVRKSNQVIFKQSKGLANKKQNIAINPTTGFRIGSISKPFTALAIMKLVEQGKLSLTDSITQIITELPLSWKNISIQHLLSHRVYISNDFFSDENLQVADQSTNQKVIQFLLSNDIRVSSLATDKAKYCNTCYVLLAEVIAKKSGNRFSEFLNQAIFIPAKMKNTYIVEKGEALKNDDALNYANRSSFFGITQYTTGAMGQVSSAEDLNNFIIALKQSRIVTQKTLKLMTRVHADLGDDGLFGLGWIIGWGDEPFFSHGGSQDGYQAELFLHPKHDLEVIILSNGGDTTFAIQAQIMRSVIRHFQL